MNQFIARLKRELERLTICRDRLMSQSQSNASTESLISVLQGMKLNADRKPQVDIEKSKLTLI